MAIKTRRWDAAEFLDKPEMIVLYLEAAFEDGDPDLIVSAIGDAARAYGITRLAADTGLGGEALDRALSAQGNPELPVVLQVLGALGLRLVPAKMTPA